jgi:hypothetical protein
VAPIANLPAFEYAEAVVSDPFLAAPKEAVVQATINKITNKTLIFIYFTSLLSKIQTTNHKWLDKLAIPAIPSTAEGLQK